MKLLDEEQTAYAKKRLIRALDNYRWRLGTGFLSTPLILYVLADMDIEYAYRLLENEEIPGWLSMPKNGATTIWESWEGKTAQNGVASLNHYSKGAVVQWLFDTMVRHPDGQREPLSRCAPARRTLHTGESRIQQRLWPGGERLGKDGRGLDVHSDRPCQLHGGSPPAGRVRPGSSAPGTAVYRI